MSVFELINHSSYRESRSRIQNRDFVFTPNRNEMTRSSQERCQCRKLKILGIADGINLDSNENSLRFVFSFAFFVCMCVFDFPCQSASAAFYLEMAISERKTKKQNGIVELFDNEACRRVKGTRKKKTDT